MSSKTWLASYEILFILEREYENNSGASIREIKRYVSEDVLKTNYKEEFIDNDTTENLNASLILEELFQPTSQSDNRLKYTLKVKVKNESVSL